MYRYKSTEELFPYWITANTAINELLKHALPFPHIEFEINVGNIEFFDPVGMCLLYGIPPEEKPMMKKQLLTLSTVILGEDFFNEFINRSQTPILLDYINTRINQEFIEFERKTCLDFRNLLGYFLGLQAQIGTQEAIVDFHKNKERKDDD